MVLPCIHVYQMECRIFSAGLLETVQKFRFNIALENISPSPGCPDDVVFMLVCGMI